MKESTSLALTRPLAQRLAGSKDGIAVAPLGRHIADFYRVINTAKLDNVATDGWVTSLFFFSLKESDIALLFVGAMFDERVDQLCFDKVVGPEAGKDMSDLTVEVGLQPPEDGQAGHQDGIAVAPLSGHLAEFN